jgi:hypothetical protein
VKDQIEDDTCSPVEYVSGDQDEDGLLDTPDSIFEDSLDETWVFRCTTRVEEDTVNTVVVDGTPVEPDGSALCPDGSGNQQGASTCVATDDDEAEVTVTGLGPDVTEDGGGPPLPGTGAPRNLGTLLALGILMVLLGSGLSLWAWRRPVG